MKVMRIPAYAVQLLVMILACLSVSMTLGQTPTDSEEIRLLKERVHGLETEVRSVREKSDDDKALLIAVFACGALCALWAQNTGRSAWLWFLLGCGFNVFTLLVLLTKNANDRFEKRVFGRTMREENNDPRKMDF